MNPVILRSLDQIRTGYSVFEKDQVLTHEQLNTVAEYFDDQTRLTRVKLLGIGIVCGLRVSNNGGQVTVSKGAGVTTDGDLLYFPADTVFNQFKLYDATNPNYQPLVLALGTKKVYELMPAELKDPLAIDQSKFADETGLSPDQMVAVLFMEGYVKDDDLCTGTDCDNLGQNLVNTIRLLVVEKAVAAALSATIPSSLRWASDHPEIVADRPLFSSNANSPGQLAAAYRTACLSIHRKLTAELPKLHPNSPAFLEGAFTPNRESGWVNKLIALSTIFARSDTGIQYYYDFLKDLVETYNHFRELLLGDRTWCCPETDSFPKHLLLGNVMAGADPDENRTGFYPSPLTSRTLEQRSHALFLAQKLDALIQTFQPPAATSTIRITPSRFEDARLEDRAIPYYYPIVPANPIHRRWNYRLHGQGKDAWNYSYNAAAYNAQGGAANPFTSQIGPFSFFRIEGQLGQPVATAVAAIEAAITANNLPFVVKPVLLGTDKRHIVKGGGIRYTDLHYLHQIVRTDLASQLDDAKVFSAHYATELNTLSPGDVNDLPQVKTIASQKDQAISGGVTAANAVLRQSYLQYQVNATAWKLPVERTVTAAAEFKQNLGVVTQTNFPTPFDSLISTTPAHWLDWLDIIIQDKGDKEDDKVLFAKFHAAHPGLEHFAGVVRGGTFVLLYDQDGTVVGDFMLPYHCCEAPLETQPQEPVLPRPPIKTAAVIEGGIKVVPAVEKYLDRTLTDYTQRVIDPKINLQKDYVKSYTDSLSTMVNVFGRPAASKASLLDTTLHDPVLNVSMAVAEAKRQQIDTLTALAQSLSTPDALRAQYTTLLRSAEADLARSVQDTAKYVSDAGLDVSPGSESFQALSALSGSTPKISDPATRNSMNSALTVLHDNTRNSGLKDILINLIRH